MQVSKSIYNRGRKYSSRGGHRVRVTKNMSALLHYILTSITFDASGHFCFEPAKDTQELLDTFNIYDIIDTYSRLQLNNKLYGDTLVRSARDYVARKNFLLYITKTGKGRKLDKFRNLLKVDL